VLLGFTAASAATPWRAFSVFACEPEWAALVRVLMPDARVYKATHARQDPHHIEARALIAQLRDADLAVCTARRSAAGCRCCSNGQETRAQDGAAGMFYAADHVSLLDPTSGHHPFDGDVHPTAIHTCRRIPGACSTRRVASAAAAPRSDAGGADRRAVPTVRGTLEGTDSRLGAPGRPARGRAVAAQHATFAYLWNWLGITQSVDLEPKPGMAPTPGHLQRVIDTRAQNRHWRSGGHLPRSAPARWIAGQLDGVLLLELPATVTDDTAVDALAGWFEQLLQALTKAAAR
jgi:zinc/manganese transport system substrate-binding protein